MKKLETRTFLHIKFGKFVRFVQNVDAAQGTFSTRIVNMLEKPTAYSYIQFEVLQLPNCLMQSLHSLVLAAADREARK